MEKKLCINCGEQLEEGARFCQHCGTKQGTTSCQNCGKPIKEGWRICPFCGAALSTDMPSVNTGWSEKRAPSIGSIMTFGTYDWRVLDVKNEKTLLIAQHVTHVNLPYNEEKTDVTWETCTLRKWLNEEFFYSFTKEEQRQIVPTANINENNQWYGTNGGRNTQDKTFLLSISEVVKYFGDSGDLKNRKGWYFEGNKWILKDSKGYAINDKFNEKRRAYYDGRTARWWLRSTGITSIGVAIVDRVGAVSVAGFYAHLGDVSCGVRPALWLSL
jgi:RNA polymerase subunit RPABC4/transcription elongation factor Spt4